MTETLSPLPTPIAWRALARRFTRSCISAKVRVRPSHAMATRSGTTDEAIIRNSAVFICLPSSAATGEQHRTRGYASSIEDVTEGGGKNEPRSSTLAIGDGPGLLVPSGAIPPAVPHRPQPAREVRDRITRPGTVVYTGRGYARAPSADVLAGSGLADYGLFRRLTWRGTRNNLWPDQDLDITVLNAQRIAVHPPDAGAGKAAAVEVIHLTVARVPERARAVSYPQVRNPSNRTPEARVAGQQRQECLVSELHKPEPVLGIPHWLEQLEVSCLTQANPASTTHLIDLWTGRPRERTHDYKGDSHGGHNHGDSDTSAREAEPPRRRGVGDGYRAHFIRPAGSPGPHSRPPEDLGGAPAGPRSRYHLRRRREAVERAAAAGFGKTAPGDVVSGAGAGVDEPAGAVQEVELRRHWSGHPRSRPRS